MKGVGSKAMSSPSRGGAAENYPPPLIMRFLRSNVGSKSRGARLRSSPMFVIRKKNVAATIETQEPSSPKVTCIGQVRVRSKNFTPSKPGHFKQSQPSQGTCTCFSPAKCSLCTPRKPNLGRWASFFRFGCCKKVDVVDKSSKVESNGRSHFNDGETEVNGNEDEEARIEKEEGSEEVLRGTTTPPKNALLLTRCRSAPFRSSSLAVQFWGETNEYIGDELKMTSCRRDFDRGESESEEKLSRKLRIGKEEESEQICAIGKQVEGDSGIEKYMEQVDMPHPLLLTRCKSESRTGEKQAK
ncbi:Chromo domain-containing protein cec-1 [Heracleum sosnowskyi]|uniref:Chromo domain-containing protein cec-1 n=1 Tax=Heracleum sosnowskyi TaxID=360622 RepID=A0AAD8IXA9_9APIA|nr:Chromo domain-containing protein cec-1 [Heracleum sosnowskyi]